MKHTNTSQQFYLYALLTGFWLAGPIMSPFFREYAGLTQFQTNLLQSIFMLVVVLTTVPAGIFADKFGRRLSVLIGLIIGGITVIWYGLFPHFWVFVLGETCFALHVSFISGADKALLRQNLKNHNQEQLTTHVVTTSFIWHMLGLLIANPIGLWLSHFGLQWPLILTSIPTMIAIWPLLRLEESKNHKSSSQPWLQQVKRGVSYLIIHPRWGQATLVAIIINSTSYFVIWLYPLLIMKLSPSKTWLSWALAGLITTELLVATYFRQLNDTHKHYFLKLAKYAVLAGFVSLLFGINPFTITLFLGLAGGIGLSYWSMFQAELQLHLPEEEQATLNSGADMLAQACLIILNPLMGWLIDYSLHVAILILTLLAATSIFLKPRR